MGKILKLLFLSIQYIIIISLLSLLYGRIRFGYFTMRFIFPSTFLVGAIIILVGIIVLAIPVRLNMKDTELIDHTTYFSAAMEKREKKRKKAQEFLFIGLGVITIAAFFQLFLSFVL